jgi:hypothetical protein
MSITITSSYICITKARTTKFPLWQNNLSQYKKGKPYNGHLSDRTKRNITELLTNWVGAVQVHNKDQRNAETAETVKSSQKNCRTDKKPCQQHCIYASAASVSNSALGSLFCSCSELDGSIPMSAPAQIHTRWTKSTYGQILSNVGAAPPPVRLRQPYGRLRPTGGFAKFNKKYLNASRRVFFAELRKAAPTLSATA